jgi:hypothetical protein
MLDHVDAASVLAARLGTLTGQLGNFDTAEFVLLWSDMCSSSGWEFRELLQGVESFSLSFETAHGDKSATVTFSSLPGEVLHTHGRGQRVQISRSGGEPEHGPKAPNRQ